MDGFQARRENEGTMSLAGIRKGDIGGEETVRPEQMEEALYLVLPGERR